MFVNGQIIAATITARYLFTFSSALYASPAKSPAKSPLRRTVTIVPATFIPRNAAASPEISTVTPNTRPSHAPALYP